MTESTNEESIETIIENTRKTFNSDLTKNLKFRLSQLKQFRKCLIENEEKIVEALWKDLRKSKYEVLIGEVLPVVNEIDYQIDFLYSNAKKHYVKRKNLSSIFDQTYLKYEPLGLILIFGAYNYPIFLSLKPMIGALAAGNCVILKPSELSSHSAQLIGELIPKYLDKNCYHIINGDVDVAKNLLQHRFDKIFYTGSNIVGKAVYEAAAKFLTPCVLELGGKNPIYLDENVDNFYDKCRIIVWAKTVNKGQTCVAPDYMLCTKKAETKFLQSIPLIMKQFYGETHPSESIYYGPITHRKHFDRIKSLIELKRDKIVYGGDIDDEKQYISFTVMANITANEDIIMDNEIFGPILPIITIETVDDAIRLIREKPKPLTINVFTNNMQTFKRFESETSSGSLLKNETMFNLFINTLPFGGVGDSGLGNYFGPHSFRTFSHAKSIMIKSDNFIARHISNKRFPPIDESVYRRFKFLFSHGYLDKYDFLKLFKYIALMIIGSLITLLIIYHESIFKET